MEGPRIFNPWNSNNYIIPDVDILRILGSTTLKKKTDLSLFRRACIHKSYVNRPPEKDEFLSNSHREAVQLGLDSHEEIIVAERPPNCLPLQEGDNEELEFIGDSILGCIVALYLHMRYPGEGEGFLTRLRTRIVNNNMLGIIAQKLGMTKWVVMSRHVEEVCDGRNNLRILGSMLEAWLGAFFQTIEKIAPGTGFQKTREWFIEVLEDNVDLTSLIMDDTNYKDQLLRWYQGHYHQPPKYKEVSVVGPPHDRIFTMGVLGIDGISIVATATARNKKVAEQEASRLAMEVLQRI